LALDVIHQVGPGGDFLTARHTLRHFRELWQPSLFDRRRSEDWIAAGSPRLGARLREKTINIMQGHQPQPLPGSVRDEVRYILDQG
jgi:trimethylamine--corrinoid protein Co-methyltransferase